MSNAPFFSIVMPTYNRGKVLDNAVNSVLNQSFTDFELIIINNHENEITSLIEDTRIKLLKEPKKGAAHARNKGIKESKGEFICFLDDDDLYLKNHLEVLYELIIYNNKEVGLYRTFSRIEKGEGLFTDQNIILAKSQELRLDHVMTIVLTMHCVCCHKTILSEMNFDTTLSVAEDYHLWGRIVAKYPLFEAPIITTIYNKTEDSVSSASLNNYISHINTFKKIFSIPEIKNKLLPSIASNRLFNYYSLILHCHLSELNFKTFVKIILGSIYYKPSFIFKLEFYKLTGKYFISKIVK